VTNTDTTSVNQAQKNPDGNAPSITFLLDKNLGLPADEKPWSDILSAAGIKATSSTDLVWIDKMVAQHEPDIAFIPIADFHRFVAKGDRHYSGFAIDSDLLAMQLGWFADTVAR